MVHHQMVGHCFPNFQAKQSWDWRQSRWLYLNRSLSPVCHVFQNVWQQDIPTPCSWLEATSTEQCGAACLIFCVRYLDYLWLLYCRLQSNGYNIYSQDFPFESLYLAFWFQIQRVLGDSMFQGMSSCSPLHVEYHLSWTAIMRSCTLLVGRREATVWTRWRVCNEERHGTWTLCQEHWLLVGGLNLSEKHESIGMMKFPIYGKIKNGNQTTNQIIYAKWCQCVGSGMILEIIWSEVACGLWVPHPSGCDQSSPTKHPDQGGFN